MHASVASCRARRDRRFLADEASLRADLEHPLRLFDLDDLGVSFDALRRDVLPSFDALPWDEYDVKRERMQLLCARRHNGDELLADLLPRYFADALPPEELRALTESLDEKARDAFAAIRPYRRRAVARFRVTKSARVRGWAIERLPDTDYALTDADAHAALGLPYTRVHAYYAERAELPAAHAFRTALNAERSHSWIAG